MSTNKHKNKVSIFNNLISRILAFLFIYIMLFNFYDMLNIGAEGTKSILLIFVTGFALYMAISYTFRYVKKYIRRKKYLASSLSQIDKMDGKEFEKYLKAVFEEKGYSVKLTKDSGDFGADLIMYKKGGFRDDKYKLPEKIIVQAKRYKGNVGIEAVQQIAAAKEYYKADTCAVATNRYFTKAAKQLAKANKVILWDREFFFGIPKSV